MNERATGESSVLSNKRLDFVFKFPVTEVSSCSITYSIKVETASLEGGVPFPKLREETASKK